jgi:hypothetical protein
MFTNTESYHYPSNVAIAFIEKCLERRSLGDMQSKEKLQERYNEPRNAVGLDDVEKNEGFEYVFEEVVL